VVTDVLTEVVPALGALLIVGVRLAVAVLLSGTLSIGLAGIAHIAVALGLGKALAGLAFRGIGAAGVVFEAAATDGALAGQVFDVLAVPFGALGASLVVLVFRTVFMGRLGGMRTTWMSRRLLFFREEGFQPRRNEGKRTRVLRSQ